MYLSSEVATYIFYVYLTPSTHTLTLTSSYSHTVPPIITQSFSETTVNVSQLVQLTCQAQGSLPLTWTWLRNEVVLTSARVGYDRSGLESTLTISHVEEGDGGVYQCRVEQMAHRTAAAANELLVTRSKSTTAPLCLHIVPTNPRPLLLSLFLPSFLSHTAVRPFFTHARLRDMLVFVGSTVLFDCSVIGFPPPQFTWKKGNTHIIDTQQGSVACHH